MFHSRDSPRLLVCDTGLYLEQNDTGFITVAICGGYISKYPGLHSYVVLSSCSVDSAWLCCGWEHGERRAGCWDVNGLLWLSAFHHNQYLYFTVLPENGTLAISVTMWDICWPKDHPANGICHANYISTMLSDAVGPFLYQLESVKIVSLAKESTKVLWKNKTLFETWK